MRRMFPKSEILSKQVPLVPGSSSTLVPDLCKSCPSRHLLIASVILAGTSSLPFYGLDIVCHPHLQTLVIFGKTYLSLTGVAIR